MKYNYNLNNLKPADRLVLPKSELGLVQHHAIYLGKDAFGIRQYIENYIGKGVRVIDESHLFRDGFIATRIEPFMGINFQRIEAVKRAISLIGKQYDLINFNCEHYANTVQHKKSYSKQVGVGIGLGLFAFVLGIGLSKQ